MNVGSTVERGAPLALRASRPNLVAGALVGVGVAALISVAGTIEGGFGQDFLFLREVGARWLETGAYYTPEQLSGPYVNRSFVDVLYPPTALLLFVPAGILPLPLSVVFWWGIPLSLLVYQAWRFRTAWTLFILGLVAVWPRTWGGILYGNTDMWIGAFVAAGTLWHWPATLVSLKPSLAPLALVGARHRSWWFAAGLLALTLPVWADYFVAIGNARELPWWYSVPQLPIIVAPLVVWALAYRRRANPNVA